MKITKKSQYALRAMLELALRNNNTPVSAKDISQSQRIPLMYLEQIFNRLKRKGLVKTLRGPKGGYVLAREASRITVNDLVIALEEKSRVTDSNEFTGNFWKRLNNSINNILISTTIKDICAGRPSKTNGHIAHKYQFHI